MPERGSGGLVWSLSLLFRGILAALRQKLHLSTCPNLASQLCQHSIRPGADGRQSRADQDAQLPTKCRGRAPLFQIPEWGAPYRLSEILGGASAISSRIPENLPSHGQ